jgi:hypothetical protein
LSLTRISKDRLPWRQGKSRGQERKRVFSFCNECKGQKKKRRRKRRKENRRKPIAYLVVIHVTAIHKMRNDGRL